MTYSLLLVAAQCPHSLSQGPDQHDAPYYLYYLLHRLHIGFQPLYGYSGRGSTLSQRGECSCLHLLDSLLKATVSDVLYLLCSLFLPFQPIHIAHFVFNSRDLLSLFLRGNFFSRQGNENEEG